MEDNYPEDWDSRRKSVYQRDNYICQNCGRKGGSSGDAELHAHHIVPKSKGGTHKPSNLVTVCKKCHKAIHGNSFAPNSHHTIPGKTSTKKAQDLKNKISLVFVNDFFKTYREYSEILDTSNPTLQTFKEAEKKEQELRDEGFSVKIKLAEIDAEELVPDAPKYYQEDYGDLLKEIETMLAKTFEMTGKVSELKDKLVEGEKYECPNCGETVRSEDSFCNNCGEDLPNWHTCSNCNERIRPEDEYCSNCGEEIEDAEGYEGVETEEVMAELIQSQEEINQVHYKVEAKMMRNMVEVKTIASNGGREKVEWEYCPNCGIRNGVFKNQKNRRAECFLCETTWKEEGLIFKKWREIGVGKSEKKSDEEWEEEGAAKNTPESYLRYIRNTDLEKKLPEIARKYF
jgi:hypothetical protein